MATWEQLQSFARTHDLKGPGLYIVSVDPTRTPLIKVGMSKNLMSRIGDYRRNLGGRLKILAVARVSGNQGTSGRDVQLAEKSMLQMIGADNLYHQREWVDGSKFDDAYKAFAYAHHAFSHGKPHGHAIYNAQDIKTNRKQNRQYINIMKDGQLERQLPVKADHNYKRLRRVLDNPY